MKVRLGVAALVLVGVGARRGEAAHPFLASQSRPVIIAHQGGGGGEAPEGTLAALIRLRERFPGAVVAIDVRATKDRQLVVLADAHLRRTSGRRRRVDRMTLAEVQALDAGACTLAQALAVIPVDAYLSVAVKAAGIEDAVAVQLRSRRQDRLMVGAVDKHGAERLRALLPQAAHQASPAMLLCFEAEAWNPFDRSDTCASADLVPLPDDKLVASLKLLSYLHGRGLAASAGPIDDEAAMERAINRGVDALVTNFPERAQAVLARRFPAGQPVGASQEPAAIEAPPSPDATAPLRVDVHSHVFNGDDIPPFMFIEKVFIKEHGLSAAAAPLAALLASSVRLAADSYRREGRAIDARLATLNRPLPPKLARPARDLLLDSAGPTPLQPTGIDEIAALLEDDPRQRQQLIQVLRRTGQDQTVKEIEALPAKQQAPKLARFVADFVKRFTVPRSRNVVDLMNTFPAVDLFVTAMVDFDLWLGETSGTSLPEQIEMMAKLAILYDGRIVPFVAYDPFRDVVTNGRSLEWVKTAIEGYGFAGVKLYPPMGFRASGNAARGAAGFRPWRSQIEKQLGKGALDGFGAQLDQRLAALFAYCAANGVPIMAHTNQSNYSHPLAREAADPSYWSPVLSAPATQSLRVNFGHFGGMNALDGSAWPHAIITTMGQHPNVFADLSNYDLHKASAYFDRLGQVLGRDQHLHGQLMYGSDWFMPTTLKAGTTYYGDYGRLVDGSCKPNAEAFFGGNAIRFLGLGAQDKNGRRLRDFYSKYKVPARWPRKVDALLANPAGAWAGCQSPH
jgi:glycerophosphoryl diester phosphodiesterase/predicted TIM-barrel fold metal-dependent hydrolase